MVDGRSKRKAKVTSFIDRLDKNRKNNLNKLIKNAKLLELEGFDGIEWEQSTWNVTKGRLIKQSGKIIKSASFNFIYSPSLGAQELENEWSDVAKALFTLRFHRKHQSAPNQRNFITAVGYVAYAANKLNLDFSCLTPEALDEACKKISMDYSESVAYNLHKAVAEFSGHCDANGLCRIIFKYKYSKMQRPENTGGIKHMRLDDPNVLKTKSDKLVAPAVFKIIGELYINVPNEHKYRFYVLLLTLLACTGRRFSEISLLPYQTLNKDSDGREYIEYFPRKISQGNVFTPRRKLYMPTDVLPIVRDVIQECNQLCHSARETALEMHRVKNSDLRFLSNLNNQERLYKKDLKEMGITPSVLDSTGWLRLNGLAFPDNKKLTKQGKKPAYPIYYTNKLGVIEYCKKDYSDRLTSVVHVDQENKKYYLKDLMFVRYQGLSSGSYSHWISTQCTHSMLTTFMRYFPELSKEYATSIIEVDFTSHHFRHTLNTLLDEGGLSDLLQTEWFGRSNPRDTKAYQHTSREKRALMLMNDIKKGRVAGKVVEQVGSAPVSIQDAILKARIHAVHDVGTGICIHNFSQLPCERHLQCSAECVDYVWVKEDKGRIDEQKRQLALATIAQETAEERLGMNKPKKSSDWFRHNNKKIKTLTTQLRDNGVTGFDPKAYLEEMVDE